VRAVDDVKCGSWELLYFDEVTYLTKHAQDSWVYFFFHRMHAATQA
jgi:hypothetical protein